MFKVKPRPPPLQLFSTEQPFQDETAINIIESPKLDNFIVIEDPNELKCGFDIEIESTLMGLLHDDELLPFNLHTAASLGITASVRHLIERYITYFTLC